MSDIDPSKLTVAELKKQLGERGLSLSGLKAALVERLSEALEAEKKEEKTETAGAGEASEEAAAAGEAGDEKSESTETNGTQAAEGTETDPIKEALAMIEKKKERAQRFGQEYELTEEDKRVIRQARFGLVTPADKRQVRAKRFGTAAPAAAAAAAAPVAGAPAAGAPKRDFDKDVLARLGAPLGNGRGSGRRSGGRGRGNRKRRGGSMQGDTKRQKVE